LISGGHPSDNRGSDERGKERKPKRKRGDHGCCYLLTVAGLVEQSASLLSASKARADAGDEELSSGYASVIRRS
jgi:hypothetical protein